jgi:hypothetical protein
MTFAQIPMVIIRAAARPLRRYRRTGKHAR